jgi:N-acyl-D-amino-acid deacylase
LETYLFSNVRIVDGSGGASFIGHVLIEGGLITAVKKRDCVGQIPTHSHVIPCNGLTLAPGFIDVHTHDDALMLQAPETSNNLLGEHPKLSQGITTVITGNCGVSLAPLIHPNPPAPLDILGKEPYKFNTFEAYFNALEAHRPICNVASLVGHTTLRVASGIDLSKEADFSARAWMASQVESALKSGALGLSTGVFYPPARAATTAELIEVCKPLASYNAPVTMHLRNEADDLEGAMTEAFAVGREAGCSVVLSHHKVIGAHNAGKSIASLALLSEIAKTQSVCVDCYPYDASSTMLIPERIAMSRDILITWSGADPSAAGRSLNELAKERNTTPEVLAQQLLPAGAVYFAMDEGDVQRILSHPLTMIGSDGIAHDRAPHPRLWGSFPRVIGRYSRDLKLFSLETAIYKMTGLSAKRFGLDCATAHRAARGQIQEGWAADLVLFDAEKITDNATFANPTQAPSGIERVYVNGQLAAKNGQTLNAHAGQVLRNERYQVG